MGLVKWQGLPLSGPTTNYQAGVRPGRLYPWAAPSILVAGPYAGLEPYIVLAAGTVLLALNVWDRLSADRKMAHDHEIAMREQNRADRKLAHDHEIAMREQDRADRKLAQEPGATHAREITRSDLDGVKQ